MSEAAGESVPYVRTRLSIQMFLQFAIWGSWIPVLALHLDDLEFEGGQIGAIYGTGALASMISPLIAGQLADRYFPTQIFLAIAYFFTGGLFF